MHSYYSQAEIERQARKAPMTDPISEFGVYWQELPPHKIWKQLRMALALMDWSPRKWATRHDACWDLPTAWWAAGHAIEYEVETASYWCDRNLDEGQKIK